MTEKEKEKKAITNLIDQVKFWKKNNIENSDDEILLNLIDKQIKEIQELNAENKELVNQRTEGFLENDRLKKEIEELKKDRYVYNDKTGEITIVKSNSISKDKIRAKIKEIDKDELLQKIDFGQISLAIKVLYELLEE